MSALFSILLPPHPPCISNSPRESDQVSAGLLKLCDFEIASLAVSSFVWQCVFVLAILYVYISTNPFPRERRQAVEGFENSSTAKGPDFSPRADCAGEEVGLGREREKLKRRAVMFRR